MNIPANISDMASDKLVELFFLALPSMDQNELVILLGAILNVCSHEVRRAVEEERQRCLKPSSN